MPVSLEDYNDSELVSAAHRFAARLDRVHKTMHDISRGRESRTESRSRMELFEKREALKFEGSVGLQRRLGTLDSLLPYEFLEHGMLTGQAVGMVSIEELNIVGSGFMIAPDVLITNYHVLRTLEMAKYATFKIGYEEDALKVQPSSPKATLKTNTDLFFAFDEKLDFCMVGVDVAAIDEQVSWLPLLGEQGKIKVGHPVNLIQHPNGRVKHIALHNSHLLELDDNSTDHMFCYYSSDSEQGSSGSPVLNNRWEVIALHHKAIPATNSKNQILDINGKTMTEKRFIDTPDLVRWIANEGVRVSRIVERLKEIEPVIDNNDRKAKMLALWDSPKSRRIGLKIGWSD